VPIQQQRRLEQVLGSLEIGQNPAVLEDNIKRVINIYNDIIFGSKNERLRLLDAGDLTGAQFDQIQGMYHDLSFDERGNPIERAGPEVGSGEGGPRVGEVIDGFRFNGGEPGDQSNWSAVE
jgi:hypothetical protein